ncbi:MAG: type II toxin-antitoxin system RelE/ParE family toxin [Nocardioidaceae bacterium]
MSLPYSIYSEAAQELHDAVIRYNLGGRGRGRKIKAAYDAALDRVRDWPESGTRDFYNDSDTEVRKVKIARSDLWIVYFVENNVLFVVAVAHERREPGYWRNRIDQ